MTTMTAGEKEMVVIQGSNMSDETLNGALFSFEFHLGKSL